LESRNRSIQLAPGIERPGLEADNHKRHSINMKDEPAVTAVTVRIAAVVRESCAFTFCW